MALIAYLPDSTTVIRLHQWEKRRLEIVASVNKEPLVGETLWGDWSLAPCGLIEEDLGTTDANGRVVVEEFYPDEWWDVFFRSEGADIPSWRADPHQLSGIVHVELESWPTYYKGPVDVWPAPDPVPTDTWQTLLPD